ncbi:MAG: cupin [Alphaproteobacteria bacterium]|nr:cupin [Alphaproteobacteria bacterium]
MDDLNADLTRYAFADLRRIDWERSPAPGVWRRRLDRVGGEAGRATSLVRFDPGARFLTHPHPGGEEILVLDGTFEDEHGAYPAGSYLLNPAGFEHESFSTAGCTLFVKLRQYAGADRVKVALDSNALAWKPGRFADTENRRLYTRDGTGEFMQLTRISPGCNIPLHDHPGGEEVLLLEGDLEDENGRCEGMAWVRYPDGSRHAPRSTGGCLLYVKYGGLRE